LTAITAALRLVLESFFSKELLFTTGENELIPAVFAGQHFVFHRKASTGTYCVKER
jgi:hypothetical protein